MEEDNKISATKKISRTRINKINSGDNLETLDANIPTEDEYPTDTNDNFVIAHENGLSEDEVDRRLKIYGKNELPEKKIPKWYIFVSQLWQPMPIMIWIAAAIEGAIQNFIDMSILLFIQV
jgi:H+-transporting ATPase